MVVVCQWHGDNGLMVVVVVVETLALRMLGITAVPALVITTVTVG